MPRRWETGSRHITNSEFGAAPILCHRLLQISKKFGTQNCSYGVFISAKFQLSWSWRISLLLRGQTEAMSFTEFGILGIRIFSYLLSFTNQWEVCMQ